MTQMTSSDFCEVNKDKEIKGLSWFNVIKHPLNSCYDFNKTYLGYKLRGDAISITNSIKN